MPGTLSIVATPIGNLEDLTERAKRVLSEVDLIACEDTRVTRKLLSAFALTKELTSLHQHTTCAKEKTLIQEILSGTNVALVTDAGTPAVSDPGARFVRLAVEAGISVIPIPGPSALTAAISVSGFATSPFTFLGFPPSKKGRAKFFEQLAAIPHTLVLYESKHRIQKTLAQLPSQRQALVARELTKVHETLYRGSVEEIIKKIEKDARKGEFVIVLGPTTGRLL